MVGLIYVGIAIALLLVSRSLLKKNSKPLGTSTPSTLSERGSFVNLIIGTRSTGYFFAWRGNPRTKTSGGGGKSFGGGGNARVTTYESGWHIPCLGPARQLHAIEQGGKIIWQGPIDSSNTPSGSSVTLPNGEGTFIVHWGEIDQPVNAYVGDNIPSHVYSRWPGVMQITWVEKSLGSGSTWPELKYVITCDCFGTGGLQDSPPQLDNGISRGVNPAHGFVMLTTAPFPWGRGMPRQLLDNASWEALGVLGASEHLPMNVLIENGQILSDFFSSCLADLGVLMPQVGGRLMLIPVRPSSDAVPDLGDDVIVAPDISRDIDRGDDPVTRFVYTFDNETNWAFNKADIVINDDAEASEVGGVTTENVGIAIATEIHVASRIARRRSQEPNLKVVQTVSALRAARLLVPGQAFTRDGFRYIVTSSKRADDSPAGTLEIALDTYAVPDIDDVGFGGSGSGQILPAEPDDSVRIMQTSIGGDVAIVVLRVRAHNQIIGAFVHISTFESYARIGNQDTPCVGGVLTTDQPDGTGGTLATGPTFEASNADVANVLDLSSDFDSWNAGRQIMVINDEVFFLESITLQAESDWAATTAYSPGDAVIPTGSPTGLRYVCLSGGTSDSSEPSWPTERNQTIIDGTVLWQARYFAYQTVDALRAKEGTSQGYHSAGDQVWIADRNTLTAFRNVLIASGNFLLVKTQPFTNSDVVDLAEVTAATISLT